MTCQYTSWTSYHQVIQVACRGKPARVIALYQLNRDPTPHHCSCPLQAAQSDVVLRIEQTVYLRATCLKQRRHLVLGNILLLHRISELPCDNFLDGLRLRLIKDSFLFEEIINAGTHM